MSYEGARRAPMAPVAPSLECPLASLGRNSNTVVDSRTYYHPLSSSPLDPQVYKMSCKSPDLSIDANDIMYKSLSSQRCNAVDGLIDDLDDIEKDASTSTVAAVSRGSKGRPDIFQMTRSSSHNSLELALPVQRKAATFELRSRHGFQGVNGKPTSVGRNVPRHQRTPTAQQRNFLALEHLLHYGLQERTPRDYLLHGSIADTEESSDTTEGNRHITRHQGGRCSVPTVCTNVARNAQLYLGKKMDTLYVGNAMRGLQPSSEETHFQNYRFFLEDGLRNVCRYSNKKERQTEPHMLHHPTSKVKSLSDGLCNIGRFSPNLDQGYATLVSPSPTGHHTNTITTHSVVHHRTKGTITVDAKRHVDTSRQPWNKKGPFRSGPLFERLPNDVVLKVFNWLNSCDLCNVARVCRRFEHLAWRPVLWKVISLNGEHLNGDKTLKMIFRQLCGQSHNGSCPDVERVILSDGCRISNKGLQLLARRCPELTHLQLHMCVNVTNQVLMDVLTKCTNLQHLDVMGCSQVNSISPNLNLEPPRRLLLQYLDLTDCMVIDDLGLKIVVKNCPQLVYLYLRRCIQITDTGLKFVPSFCIALKELSVSDCINITDFGLYELAKLGAALRYLSVAKCDRVSDAGLKVIARRCYKLRYLNARGCEAVSDDSITMLARSCPRLRALDIGKCDVSDAGLRALAESCPNLKKLSLRNCDMITDRGVQCIAYYCRGLQQLNIQDCQISIEGYRSVKKYCKRCIIEHTNPGFC